LRDFRSNKNTEKHNAPHRVSVWGGWKSKGKERGELLLADGDGLADERRVGSEARPRLARVVALREPEGRLDGGLRDPLEDQRLDHVGVDAPICLVADVENAVSRRVEDLGGVLMCLEAHSALPGLAGVAREDLLHPGVPRHRFLVDAAVERDLGFASREREAGTEDADVGVGTLRHLVPEHRVLLELGERLRPEILHEQLARIGVGDDQQSCRRMHLGDAVPDLSLRCAIAHALADLVLVPRRRLVPLEDELLHPDRETRLGRLHDHEQMSSPCRADTAPAWRCHPPR
jgi:hypothetical protein